jgi:hypothetical protein
MHPRSEPPIHWCQPVPQPPDTEMPLTETRLDLVAFTCPGCDCGECLTGALREMEAISGVEHVRIDRMRTQIVVRHDPDGVTPVHLRDIVKDRGST